MRLFLAIDPPPDVRAAIGGLLERCKARAPEVKTCSLASIHVTLVFLGSIGESSLDGIQRDVSSVCGRHAAFDLSARGSGLFPSRARPQVLWLGVGGDTRRAAALARDLGEAMSRHGVQLDDRPYTPHVTLARAKTREEGQALAAIADDLADADAGAFRASEVILYESVTRPSGAEYKALSRASLS